MISASRRAFGKPGWKQSHLARRRELLWFLVWLPSLGLENRNGGMRVSGNSATEHSILFDSERGQLASRKNDNSISSCTAADGMGSGLTKGR